MQHKKRAALYTLGCRLNQSETALIHERLEAAGYAVVSDGAPADLNIVNTCTVTREADAKSRQLIRSLIRRNPQAFTAVVGCYSQMGYRTLSEIEGIDLIVGNQEKLNVLDYVGLGKNRVPLIVRDRLDRDDFTVELTGGAGLHRRANLKIQDGCNFMCSFCIIPFARGRARSRVLDNIVEEAQLMAQRGVKEIVLTGVNVGTYRYQAHTIADVVDCLNRIEGIERIRISSIEPTTVPNVLLDWMNDPTHRLVPYLHLPAQSGSDRVLARMKRKYTADEYLDFTRHAAATVRDLCIGTDVMVGFPGETEEDFEATCQMLKESPIVYAHVFKYSERAGTPAARSPDRVPPGVADARSAEVRRISAEKRRNFQQRYLGDTMDVLFEERDGEFWPGLTGNYLRVAVRSNERVENTVRRVVLDEICCDFMVGHLANESLDGSREHAA
ncbi:MAG: tRNA (N(6)-L-threonylcarbamoyladenosine(37)-C(2))-methylthiotransferase MtaB [Candidatus Hydrogenedentes bacterium]|nr:tRNA (N(6)-L-threonylcarbamoyladenosine(37)-C(2))-methylthiotransferase MtaB [Candidatus Hydrogenedentota bacterium]